jgi:hypothetical protein
LRFRKSYPSFSNSRLTDGLEKSIFEEKRFDFVITTTCRSIPPSPPIAETPPQLLSPQQATESNKKIQKEIVEKIIDTAIQEGGANVLTSSISLSVELLLRIDLEEGRKPTEKEKRDKRLFVTLVHPSERILEFFRTAMEFTACSLQATFIYEGVPNPFDFPNINLTVASSEEKHHFVPMSNHILICPSLNYFLFSPTYKLGHHFKYFYLNEGRRSTGKPHFYPNQQTKFSVHHFLERFASPTGQGSSGLGLARSLSIQKSKKLNFTANEAF